MGGSGFASYENAHDAKYRNPVDVPLKLATEAALRDYGRIVQDFEAEEVWITPWPVTGPRPLCAGTGIWGGVTEGLFEYRWEGELLKAINKAVPDGDYTTGRLPADVRLSDRTHVLVREANYHPDGGQVFYPAKLGEPFVALLALPGDDIKPEDFVAFYFDGTFGLQIKAGIWHQPMYPIHNEMLFKGKQGRVHAAVVVDTVDEFGKYLRVPLKQDFAL